MFNYIAKPDLLLYNISSYCVGHSIIMIGENKKNKIIRWYNCKEWYWIRKNTNKTNDEKEKNENLIKRKNIIFM